MSDLERQGEPVKFQGDVLVDIIIPARNDKRLAALIAVEAIDADTVRFHNFGAAHEIRRMCKTWLRDNPEPAVVNEGGSGARLN